MAQPTPHVEHGTLLLGRPDAEQTIAVDSPAWFLWLETATAFSFAGPTGTYVARRERASSGRGGWYWRAYQHREGTRRRAYLGKPTELTLERLQAVAASLAGPGAPKQELPQPGANEGLPVGESIEHLTLPTGTATFLFTDIEGSTQLWEQHREAMKVALARHDSLLRQAIAAHGGVVFKTVGDSAHAVFARTADALAAAVVAQRALHQEAWDNTRPLRVRMALHTGAAELREGDYFGPPLNRLARILALGHGGQILLSRAVHDLVADDLPAQTSLRALGEYALKDLARPEPIFQCISADLMADFPPLRSDDPRAGTGAPSLNLLATKLYIPQAQPTLVARPRLLERLRSGLTGKLTLITAPAGFGKTTLLTQGLGVGGWELGSSPANSQSPIPGPPQVAWLSLDPTDNDPTTFLRYLIAALQTIVPDIGATALALLRSPQLPPIDTLMTALLNDAIALPQAALLVLDDYHVITMAAIHQALGFLLDHLPPQLHLIIATREDPPLLLARLRARGQLTELRAADLRFTPDEATSFLADTMMLPLTAEAIAALETRTEGWIAGLQLAALAMRDRSDLEEFVAAFTGSNRFVVDYLMEEVFSRQPAYIQTFLLQTAILDRMCGPLCDVVLGVGEMATSTSPPPSAPGPQAYSQLILEALERANLFLVPLDDERCWYRYHHLFAEVLRSRFLGMPLALHPSSQLMLASRGGVKEAAAELHRRASVWYEAQGLMSEAVEHTLMAQDWERAAEMIEQAYISLMLHGQVQTLLDWLTRLGDAPVRTRPMLGIVHADLLIITSQFQAAGARLQRVEQSVQAGMPSERDQAVLGKVASARAGIAWLSGNLTDCVALASQALDLLPLSDPPITERVFAGVLAAHAFLVTGDVAPQTERQVAALEPLARASGNIVVVRHSLNLLARLQVLQGHLRQAAITYQKTSPPQLGQEQPHLLAWNQAYYAGMGDLLREWNDLDAARRQLEQWTDLVAAFAMPHEAILFGFVTKARLQYACREYSDAIATLEMFMQLARQRSFVASLVVRARAIQTQLCLAQGDVVSANQWLADCGLTADDELSFDREVEHITLARVLVAQGRSEPATDHLHDALRLLDRLLQAAERSRRLDSAIEIHILQALAYQTSGDRNGALVALSRALALAAPEGYVRVFVDEGAPMLALLREAYARGIARDYIATLLAAFPEAQSDRERRAQNNDTPALRSRSLERSSALVEPLTARELEVLQLLAAGASNGAIAEALVISIGTAKKHVNNILAKLDVRSRTQAAIWAREHGLLAERLES
jgi:LuxR family maltose regulon positive regulatory protein